MNFKILKSLSNLILCLLFAITGWAQNSYNIEVTFVDHLKAGLIEQDVFVTKDEGPNKVFRVFPEERETYIDAPLYKSKQAHEHNPFDKTHAGPYKKGEDLDITLGDWLEAKGTASCSCEGGWGKISASFEKLMPNAKYTMWHAFLAKNNTDHFIGTFDLPVGARDGSQSVFKTDKNGNAKLEVAFENCLQLTDSQLMSMLAIAWHSDDKTYGVEPGPFGLVTHIQLFAMLPDVDEVSAQHSKLKGNGR